MPEDSIEGILKNFFSHSTRSDWKKMAMEETKGKDPLQILSWHGKDEILFLPYYDAHDTANLDFLNPFQTPASETTFSSPKAWLNLPQISATNQGSANALALEHLLFGADGIFFDIPKGETIDLHSLLQNIEWPFCFLAFHIHHETFSSNLSEFLRNQSSPGSISGALFWESIPKTNTLEFYFDHCRNLKSLGLIIPPGPPAVEISNALARAVETWEILATGADPDYVLRSITFSLSVDPGMLETVAKIKALRMLWLQVVHAYGLNDYKAGDLHIHARSLMVADSHYAPHENMLKGAYSAIAAVLGGCDSLSIDSVTSPLSMRWARNVSSILREESFFSSVADPIAGSYALDNMVNEIARKAWGMFQKKMAEV
jgi:methylmalonyl-CoA mutase